MGLGVVIIIIVVATLVGLYVDSQHEHPHESPTAAVLRAAIWTTFPGFCADLSHQLSFIPSKADPSTWEVHCDPNPIYLPPDTPMMTVNITTCVVQPTGSLTLEEQYPELFKGLTLANCPIH